MANGLAQLRNDLKAAKNEMAALAAAGDTTSAAFVSAAAKAGALKDQLNDINEQVNVFAGGSKFEIFGNQLGAVGDKLKNLDFAGAAEEAKKLASLKINFKDGIKSLKDLGSTFMSLGKALLTNPLFIFAAIITAIIIAVVALKDKIKIVGDVFKFFGDIIGKIVQLLKDLGDWLGLTSFAAEEKAKVTIESAKKEQAALEDRYNKEIALAAAAGQVTTQMELAKQQAMIETNKKIIDGYAALKEANGELTDEEQKDLDERVKANDKASLDIQVIWIKLYTKIAEESDKATQALMQASLNSMQAGAAKERALVQNKYDEIYKTRQKAFQDEIAQAGANETLKAQIISNFGTLAAADGIAKQAELDRIADANRKADIQKYKDYLAARLMAARTIKDLELAAMQNGFEKDKAINDENYARKIEDVKKNEKLTADEKKSLTALYKSEQAKTDKALEDKYNKEAEDREREHQANIFKIKQQQKQNEESLIKDLRALRDELYMSDVDKALSAEKIRAEKQRAIALEGFEKGKIDKKQYEDAIAEIDKQSAEKQKEINDKAAEATKEESVKKLQAAMAQIMMITGLATSAVTNVLNAVQEKRDADRELEAQKMEGANTTEINALTEKFNKGLITEKQYNDGKKSLDSKLKAAQLSAARKAFEEDKKLKIAQATITGLQGGLQAFTSALSLGPIAGPIVGGILAGVVAASTASTINNIKRSQFDSGASAIEAVAPVSVSSQLSGSSSSTTPSLFGSGSSNTGSGSTSGEGERTGNGSANNVMTVRAVVVAQEITDTQALNNYANNIGTL